MVRVRHNNAYEQFVSLYIAGRSIFKNQDLHSVREKIKPVLKEFSNEFPDGGKRPRFAAQIKFV